MPTLTFPSYPFQGGNLPEMHFVFGSFAAAAVPTIKTGKGFTVARVSPGIWDVTLGRRIAQIVAVLPSCNLVGLDDIVSRFQNQAANNQTFRFLTLTGAVATDPTAGSDLHFVIAHMNVKLPVK